MTKEITAIEAGLVETIKQLEADKAELVREMERYLPILQAVENDAWVWDRLTKGTGIATTNGYAHAIQKHGSNQ